MTIATRLRADWSDPAGVTGGSPLHKLARRILPLETRWTLAERAFQAKTQWRLAGDLARELGWGPVARLRFAQWATPFNKFRKLTKVQLPGYRYPIYYREGTSDPFVIEQVFARKEYACIAGEPAVRFIVDGGANVGYTAFYLLHHYPAARIAVVEPDAGNLAVCRKNLAPFGDRVTFIQAGIWDAPGPMTLDRSGEEWAFVARPAKPGEAVEFQAVTVADVMARTGFPHVDLLKLDIEGAEEVAFAGSPPWLDRITSLVIELHGPACEAAVAAALDRFSYERSTSGELTVFRHLTPRTA